MTIKDIIGNAEQLREMLENGEVDIAFSGISPRAPECIEKDFLFEERLYLVVSEQMLELEGVTLDYVHTSGHFDLHQQMAPENLAACFSLSMYLPHLHELNLYKGNKLLVFPIKDLTETNPVYILTNKEKTYVEGTNEFKDLLKNVVKDLEVSDM